jgi:hypothetical protein
MAVSAPDAIPENEGSTLPSSADVIAGTISPPPTPVTVSPATVTTGPAAETAPATNSPAHPAAIATAPVAIAPRAAGKRRTAKLPASTPASTGTKASPVTSGERCSRCCTYKLTLKYRP